MPGSTFAHSPCKPASWTTEISHRTRHITIKVIFPKSRPPRYISIVEQNSQRTHLLEEAFAIEGNSAGTFIKEY